MALRLVAATSPYPRIPKGTPEMLAGGEAALDDSPYLGYTGGGERICQDTDRRRGQERPEFSRLFVKVWGHGALDEPPCPQLCYN